MFSRRSSAKSHSPRKTKSSFFKKQAKSTLKSAKPHRPEERKGLFVKPEHDPGPKIRGGSEFSTEGYTDTEGGNAVQQALQNTGCGCCGSIAGFIWFLAIGGLAVIILLIVKCGGC
jgi:hypothetical protein